VQVAEPLGDYLRVGSTRSVLALVHGLAGDADAGLQLKRPVLRLVEGAEGDVFVPGLARAMGPLHLWRGDPAEAASWFRPEAGATERGTETWLAAQSLPGLGAALIALGRFDEASSVLERAVAAARRLDMPRVDALEQQAIMVAADAEDSAIDLHHEALAVRVEYGLRTFFVDSLDALAGLSARAERSSEAARVLAASNAARTSMGYPRDPVRQRAYEATLASVEATLGEQPVAEAWRAGAGLTLDAAVANVRRSPRRAPSTVHRLGQPHSDGARCPPTHRRWPQQPGDWPPPVHEPRDSQDPPVTHLRQARSCEPNGACRGPHSSSSQKLTNVAADLVGRDRTGR
jgi:hypothetical protein